MYKSLVIGIDEVGRGPIAGPVCVAAFVIKQPAKLQRKLKKVKLDNRLPLRDSKKLSKNHREVWNSILKDWKKEGLCDFAITFVHAKTIDRIGIAPSIKRALELSLYKLRPNIRDTILLDGGLKAPVAFVKQKTIIKGDEKEVVIAFASIVAKVYRDQFMSRLAKKYPDYGMASHVGYGTQAHYKAIKKYGLLPEHRKSFLRGK